MMADLKKYESLFCQRTKVSLSQLQNLIKKLSSDFKDRDILNECHLITHTVCGGAAVMGCEGLGKTVRVADQVFLDALKGKVEFNKTLIEEIKAAVENIYKISDDFEKLKAFRPPKAFLK